MRADELRSLFKRPKTHIVLAVVHVLDAEQAIRNANVARKGGAHGVLLINHDFGMEKFIPIVRSVRKAIPNDQWLGINFLAVPLRAAAATLGELAREGVRIDGYWADDAQIDEHSDAESQSVAQWALEAAVSDTRHPNPNPNPNRSPNPSPDR